MNRLKCWELVIRCVFNPFLLKINESLVLNPLSTKQPDELHKDRLLWSPSAYSVNYAGFTSTEKTPQNHSYD